MIRRIMLQLVLVAMQVVQAHVIPWIQLSQEAAFRFPSAGRK